MEELKFVQIRNPITELPALERQTIDVATFSRLFSILSFSYLHVQVLLTCMRAWRISKFDQIRPPTAELAAHKCLKNPYILITGKSVLTLFLGCS